MLCAGAGFCRPAAAARAGLHRPRTGAGHHVHQWHADPAGAGLAVRFRTVFRHCLADQHVRLRRIGRHGQIFAARRGHRAMMETLPAWAAIPVALLLVASGFLTLTGSLGLLRLPSFYSRIHSPTLGNTLGVFGVLLAPILVSSTLEGRYVVHQILITVFLVITSPVTAMLLMRAEIGRASGRERGCQYV